MNPLLRYVIPFAVVFQLWAGAAPISAQTPESRDAAIDRLAASVDRLAALLERESAFRAQEREDRRVEVASGILALRYRKVEQIEQEVRRIAREEEDVPDIIAMMKMEIARLEKADLAQGDQPSGAMRSEIDAMEARIRLEEDRAARMRERKLVLENDLTAEKRRLTHVEAVLDEWLDGLE